MKRTGKVSGGRYEIIRTVDDIKAVRVGLVLGNEIVVRKMCSINDTSFEK